MTQTVPVFPLHTVLFPGGMLPLRVFENRYLEMVSECLHSNSGFAVCLIESGREVGQAARFAPVGTYARIIHSREQSDGHLGILVRGQQRLRVLDSWVEPSQLVRARIRLLDPEPAEELPAAMLPLRELYLEMRARAGAEQAPDPDLVRDAVWLGNRLAEALPLAQNLRQELLEAEALVRVQRLFLLLQEPGAGTGMH